MFFSATGAEGRTDVPLPIHFLIFCGNEIITNHCRRKEKEQNIFEHAIVYYEKKDAILIDGVKTVSQPGGGRTKRVRIEKKDTILIDGFSIEKKDAILVDGFSIEEKDTILVDGFKTAKEREQ